MPLVAPRCARLIPWASCDCACKIRGAWASEWTGRGDCGGGRGAVEGGRDPQLRLQAQQS
eukprot:6083057-Prymnesium_polylepis.1